MRKLDRILVRPAEHLSDAEVAFLQKVAAAADLAETYLSDGAPNTALDRLQIVNEQEPVADGD